MLRLLLSHTECQVTAVLDALDGLAALKETRFDWMVVDGQMLPMDGFELAERAKEVQPSIKIVMISGIYGLQDIVGRPIGKIFQKPVDTDALASYLRSGGGYSPTA